jgi:hypothetical protein
MVNDGRRWKRTSLSISCPGVICYRQRVHKEPKIEWGLLEKKSIRPAGRMKDKLGSTLVGHIRFLFFSLRSDHQRNWSHLYNSTCLPYKNIEMGKKETNGLFLGAPRVVCQAKGFVCVHRLTLDRQFFFSPYLLRLQRMRKEKGLHVCDTNVAIVSNFLPLSSKCGNRSKGGQHNE